MQKKKQGFQYVVGILPPNYEQENKKTRKDKVHPVLSQIRDDWWYKRGSYFHCFHV